MACLRWQWADRTTESARQNDNERRKARDNRTWEGANESHRRESREDYVNTGQLSRREWPLSTPFAP